MTNIVNNILAESILQAAFDIAAGKENKNTSKTLDKKLAQLLQSGDSNAMSQMLTTHVGNTHNLEQNAIDKALPEANKYIQERAAHIAEALAHDINLCIDAAANPNDSISNDSAITTGVIHEENKQNSRMAKYGNNVLLAAMRATLENNPSTTNEIDIGLSNLMFFGNAERISKTLTRSLSSKELQHFNLTQEQLNDTLPKARTLIQERVKIVGNTLISNIEASMEALAPETNGVRGDKASIPEAQKPQRNGV